MLRLSNVVLFLAIVFVTFSCGKEEVIKKIDDTLNTTTYDTIGYNRNSTAQAALLSQIEGLIGQMETANTQGVSNYYSSLLSLYEDGSPKLATIGTTFFDAKIKNDVNGWLLESVRASSHTWTPNDSTTNGGVYGAYLFDENGLDMHELVEKVMFGSVLYKHATDLLAGQVSDTTVDRVLTIFGGNPTFPNTSNEANTSRPDLFMAKYAARRDKNDGNGYYGRLKFNFRKLKAAIKGGSKFDLEKAEAIVQIRETWEKAVGASVVNYCKTVQSKLSNTSLTDADKASALHSLTEAIGFSLGMKYINPNRKIITDAQIDELLALFNYSETVRPTCYRFALRPEQELPKLQQAIARLKTIYGFTDQEITDFSKNWIVEQGR